MVIQWQPSALHGWGVYGLNLALAWRDDPQIEPVCSVPVCASIESLDRLRRRALAPFLAASEDLQNRLRGHDAAAIRVNAPVLAALTDDFRSTPCAGGKQLTGEPTVGMVFFETAQLDERRLQRASSYPLVVTGSTWNTEVLRAHGVASVRTVLQGIDPTLFHPAPRAGILGGRFAVFSGGKLEFRKGQDLVLQAFRAFAARHKEAVLVTAWHSPWPELAREFHRNPQVAPVSPDATGRIDVSAWAQANGIAREQFVDLGPVPNASMPAILREMDVALFPNRCEGGTNLVAMECMACGVPVVLSKNSGHLDLIREDNCFVLERQDAAASQADTPPGWGNSDVEEILATLEGVRADREAAQLRAKNAAEMMRSMTWRHTAQRLRDVLAGYLGASA